MPWRLARTTLDLNDDPDWTGTVIDGASGPSADLFFRVGVPGGAAVRDGKISIRVGWVNETGSPVATAGSCTVGLVSMDVLPMPGFSPGQTLPMASQGSIEAEIIDVAAWEPIGLAVDPPVGRWAVRLSAMVNASATRACVWYWVN